jgi:hypothetical protein
MPSFSITSTITKLPYSGAEYRSDLSESTTELLYQHCHASFAKRIENAITEIEMDEGEERPSAQAISSIVNLIEKVARTKSLFQPDVSVFYGEVIVTWRFGKREVTLLSRGGENDPKMLKYEANDNDGRGHQAAVVRVTDKQLTDAIHYSRKTPGWLYE